MNKGIKHFQNVLLRWVRFSHYREKHFIRGNENVIEFFEGHYSLPCLFHRLLKKEYVHLNGTLYNISYNSHPECQRVKMELIKMLGIEDFELWKCPEEYVHLLKKQ